MTSMLAFCACGHPREEHRSGGACTHLNHDTRLESRDPEVRAKARQIDEPCTCTRFRLSEQLPDSEVFLAKQLHAVMRKEGVPLEHADKDDLLQVMRISLWKASDKYDSRSHIRFGSYASFEVYNDAIDEIRSARMFGRHGQHRLKPLAPPPTEANDSWYIDPRDPLDDDASGASRLERVIAEFTVDPPDAGDVALRWALAEDDREALRPARERGGATPDRAPSGASDPAWASGLAALTSTEEAA